MMQNIVLAGFMGTGKSEVARALSRICGMKLVDIDREIEASQQKSISEIFAQQGEDQFRQIETAAIRQSASEQGVIISTGGGAVLKEENVRVLQEHGIIFCLTASPETIMLRTAGNTDRPLLQSDDRLARISELLKERQPYYEKAGIMINTEGKTPVEVAEEIAGKLSWTR
ncbi:MAG: shikimate kinase [Nitrospirae bacterium]|nr:shikimate kinase [Nitrospirota bacterium]